MTPNRSLYFRSLLFIIPVFSAGLAIPLVLASSNSGLLQRFLPALLIITGLAVILMIGLTARLGYKLFKQWKTRQFGSKIATRLAVEISLIAILPCLLIYAVSSQFIGRSIDSWFNVRVEHALDSGVELSRASIDHFQKQTADRTLLMADALSDLPDGDRAELLPKLRERYGLNNAFILGKSGSIIATSMTTVSQKLQIPSVDQLAAAQQQGIYTTLLEDPAVSNSAGENVQIFALAPIKDESGIPSALREQPVFPDALLPRSGGKLKRPSFYLVIQESLPAPLATNISALTSGYRDYQELVLSRGSLLTLFKVSLTVCMLLAAFGALSSALAYAEIMVDPLRQLARGTRKVAGGNLSPIQEFSGSSEVNVLTQDFNTMVNELAEARDKVRSRTDELERTGQFLQSILSNLSTGVIVMDSAKVIITANQGAARILGDAVMQAGASLREVSPQICQALDEAFVEISQPLGENNNYQREIEVARIGSPTPLTLLIRASQLNLSGEERQTVLVIDDMTQVISGQRAMAWGEVARRLAHEIKNPLTPIQLAAERLGFKLSGKLGEADAKLLSRSISTIVTQVSAMKQMVDDFRNYAKLPPASLKETDMNRLVKEIVALYVQAGKPVECQTEEPLPTILADEAQLRQVFHNLLSNSLDAIASKADGKIVISTQTLQTEGKPIGIRLQVTDNGTGFSPSILHKSFEPYATTKATGTGLGLPMVKKIVDEHKAEISLRNVTNESSQPCGAQVSIDFRISPLASGNGKQES